MRERAILAPTNALVDQLNTEILSGDAQDKQEVRLLNRIIRWEPGGITWEPDPRHVELTIQELGLEGAKDLMVPGVRSAEKGKKGTDDNEGNDNDAEGIVDFVDVNANGPCVANGFRIIEIIETDEYQSDDDNHDIDRSMICTARGIFNFYRLFQK